MRQWIDWTSIKLYNQLNVNYFFWRIYNKDSNEISVGKIITEDINVEKENNLSCFKFLSFILASIEKISSEDKLSASSCAFLKFSTASNQVGLIKWW